MDGSTGGAPTKLKATPVNVEPEDPSIDRVAGVVLSPEEMAQPPDIMDPAQQPDLIKLGMFLKRSQKGLNWKPRLLMLDTWNRKLLYYESERDAQDPNCQPKKEIAILPDSIVQINPSMMGIQKKEHTFLLKNSENAFYMSAESPEMTPQECEQRMTNCVGQLQQFIREDSTLQERMVQAERIPPQKLVGLRIDVHEAGGTGKVIDFKKGKILGQGASEHTVLFDRGGTKKIVLRRNNNGGVRFTIAHSRPTENIGDSADIGNEENRRRLNAGPEILKVQLPVTQLLHYTVFRATVLPPASADDIKMQINLQQLLQHQLSQSPDMPFQPMQQQPQPPAQQYQSMQPQPPEYQSMQPQPPAEQYQPQQFQPQPPPPVAAYSEEAMETTPQAPPAAQPNHQTPMYTSVAQSVPQPDFSTPLPQEPVARFDPETGAPLHSDSDQAHMATSMGMPPPQIPAFDPDTGMPLHNNASHLQNLPAPTPPSAPIPSSAGPFSSQQPRFDPKTGQALVAAPQPAQVNESMGGLQSMPPRFDPRTGRPLGPSQYDGADDSSTSSSSDGSRSDSDLSDSLEMMTPFPPHLQPSYEECTMRRFLPSRKKSSQAKKSAEEGTQQTEPDGITASESNAGQVSNGTVPALMTAGIVHDGTSSVPAGDNTEPPRFDPNTGIPLAPAQNTSQNSCLPKFDPETGAPLNQELQSTIPATPDPIPSELQTNMHSPLSGATPSHESNMYTSMGAPPAEGLSAGMQTSMAPVPSVEGVPAGMQTSMAPVPSVEGVPAGMQTSMAPVPSVEGVPAGMQTTMAPGPPGDQWFDQQTGMPANQDAGNNSLQIPAFDPQTGMPINGDPSSGSQPIPSMYGSAIQAVHTTAFELEQQEGVDQETMTAMLQVVKTREQQTVELQQTIHDCNNALLEMQQPLVQPNPGLNLPLPLLACAIETTSVDLGQLQSRVGMYQICVSHRAKDRNICLPGSAEDRVLSLYGTSVWRKYSDFQWLHEQLQSNIMSSDVMTKESLPALPKTSLSEQIADTVMLTQRIVPAQKLSRFLNALFAHPRVQNHPAFRLFLTEDEHTLAKIIKMTTKSGNVNPNFPDLPQYQTLYNELQTVNNFFQYATEEVQLRRRLTEVTRRKLQQTARLEKQTIRNQFQKQWVTQHETALEADCANKRQQKAEERQELQQKRIKREDERLQLQTDNSYLKYVDRSEDVKAREMEFEVRAELRKEFEDEVSILANKGQLWRVHDLMWRAIEIAHGAENTRWTHDAHEWLFRHRKANLPIQYLDSSAGQGQCAKLYELCQLRNAVFNGMPEERNRLREEKLKIQRERSALNQQDSWNKEELQIQEAEREVWRQEDQRLQEEALAVQQERYSRQLKEQAVSNDLQLWEAKCDRHQDAQTIRKNDQQARRSAASERQAAQDHRAKMQAARQTRQQLPCQQLETMVEELRTRVAEHVDHVTFLIPGSNTGSDGRDPVEANHEIMVGASAEYEKDCSDSITHQQQLRQAQLATEHETNQVEVESSEAKVPHPRTQHEDEDNVHEHDEFANSAKSRRLKVDERLAQSAEHLIKETQLLKDENGVQQTEQERLREEEERLTKEKTKATAYQRQARTRQLLINEEKAMAAGKSARVGVTLSNVLARQHERSQAIQQRMVARADFKQKQAETMSGIMRLIQETKYLQQQQQPMQSPAQIQQDKDTNRKQLEDGKAYLHVLENQVVTCVEHTKADMLDVGAFRRDNKAVAETWGKYTEKAEQEKKKSLKNRDATLEAAFAELHAQVEQNVQAEEERLENGAQEMSRHSLSMPQGADQLQQVLPILCSQALRLNETSFNVQIEPLQQQQGQLRNDVALLQNQQAADPAHASQLQQKQQAITELDQQIAYLQQQRNEANAAIQSENAELANRLQLLAQGKANRAVVMIQQASLGPLAAATNVLGHHLKTLAEQTRQQAEAATTSEPPKSEVGMTLQVQKHYHDLYGTSQLSPQLVHADSPGIQWLGRHGGDTLTEELKGVVNGMLGFLEQHQHSIGVVVDAVLRDGQRTVLDYLHLWLDTRKNFESLDMSVYTLSDEQLWTRLSNPQKL